MTTTNNNDDSNDETNVGGGRPLPAYSAINPLVCLCFSVNFLDTWVFAFAKNFVWCCCAYQEKIK